MGQPRAHRRALGFRGRLEIFRDLNPHLSERVLVAETLADARALIALRREVGLIV